MQLYSPPEVSPRVSAVKIISSAFTAQSFSALTHCASATPNIFSFPEYLYWKVNLCRLLAMLAVDGIVTVSCSLVLCIHFISPDLFYFRDKCVHLVAFKAVSRILHHSHPYFIYEVIMKYIWEEYDVLWSKFPYFFSKNEVVNTAMFVYYQNIIKLLVLIFN